MGLVRCVAILCFLVATARADDVATLRNAAEKLEREARKSKDLAKYAACGHAYLDVYNKAPGRDVDTILYNAAVCFREGKAFGAALQSLELLLRTTPKSRLVPRALASSANLYARIAQFEKAAERLERYAKSYAAEKDAPQALSDAITYRRALGDHARTIELTKYFVRMFGAKRRSEAADAMVGLIPAYDSDREAQIKHLRSVLASYARDDAQKALLYAKLGDALSAQSCPVTLQDGLCVKLARERAAAKGRCAKDPVRLVAVTRTAAHRDALDAYKSAARLLDRMQPDDAVGTYFAAHARLALADAELETLLAIAPPRGNKLEPWLRDTSAALQDVTARYEAIVGMRDVATSLHAAARIGQSTQAVWRSLRLATGDCKRIDEVAAPLAKRASDAFAVCVAKAAQLGYVDNYVRMCHREGRTVDPARFPEPDLFPDPAAVSIAMIADKIGEPEWRAGRRDAAIKAWEAALKQNGKLFAPRLNLAIAQLEQLRALPTTDPGRGRLTDDATFHAQSAAAVADDAAPYVVLAALALDDKRKDGIAALLLETAIRTNDKYAPAHVGLGVLAARRDQWAAFAHFERAASLDTKSDPAQLAFALAALRVGRFDAAARSLATIKTATYDVELARGVAARGLGKLAAARAAYERAAKLDPTRTEAKHNLALLAATP